MPHPLDWSASCVVRSAWTVSAAVIIGLCAGCGASLWPIGDLLAGDHSVTGTVVESESIAEPGYWELTAEQFTSGNSKSAGVCAEGADANTSCPLGALDLLDGTAERIFLAFDQEQRLVGAYAYDADADLVYLESPLTFPLIGVAAARQSDGVTVWQGWTVQTVDSWVISVGVTLAATPLDATREQVEITTTYTFLPTAESDPNAPATWPGEADADFTCSRSASFVATSSTGPYAEQPEAQFVQRDTTVTEPPERSLAGIWALTDLVGYASNWADAEAPLARYWLEVVGTTDMFAPEESSDPDLLIFDTTPLLVASYQCDPTNRTVYVGTPADDPFLGRVGVVQDDGRVVFTVPAQSQSSPAALGLVWNGHVTATPNTDGQTWQIHMSSTMQITATEDIPANAQTGRLAIQAGDSTTFEWEWSATLEPSAGPFELCPDAEWQIADSPDEAAPASQTSDMPTGYYELAVESESSVGWSDPNSPFVLLVGGSSLPQPYAAIGDADRAFLLLDDQGTFLLNYEYVADENTVYIGPVADNPLANRRPTRDDEHAAWTWTAEARNDAGSPVAMVMRVMLAVRDGDGSSSPARAVRLTLAVTFTAVADIPADPQTGRPAIPAGASASYTVEDHYTGTAPGSPYELFPDAVFQFAESDQQQQ